MLNITNIPAPRVEFVDPRTGLMSREWYRFFLNLFVLTGGGSNDITLEELQYGAPNLYVDEIAENDKERILSAPNDSALLSQIDELQKQLDALKMQVQPQLGTMASLQQDNLPWVQFDTTPQAVPEGPAATGTVYWDNADSIQTINIVMEDAGEVIQHVGEETFYRVKASATITKGQVVMVTGALGASGGLEAAPATGLTAFQSEFIMGVATQNIANNDWGYITWFGEVKQVNTTGGAEAWVDGQILYFNPAVAGGLTKNVPTAPNPKVIVASVVHAATNGILFVRPTFGSALGATDSNVQITSLANNDVLVYDSTDQRWENKAPVAARDALGLGSGSPSNGQLLIGNGTDFTSANLTAGSNISITNGSGSITINAAGVTGATGTFTTADVPPQIVTVLNGVITSIV